MTMLEARNVTKRFGNLVAVNDISINVAPGELPMGLVNQYWNMKRSGVF